jgi:hypothetical protein
MLLNAGVLRVSVLSGVSMVTTAAYLRVVIIWPFEALAWVIFKNSVRTTKKTQHFTITKINWLTLFKEIVAVYSENHTKPINTKWRVIDCRSRWEIYLPLGIKGLIQDTILQKLREHFDLRKSTLTRGSRKSQNEVVIESRIKNGLDM